MPSKLIALPDELIEDTILLIRGKRVILDRELARLYGVSTKVLNQTVKRNADRFPEDFMFQLTKEETKEWQRAKCLRSQIVILKKDKVALLLGGFCAEADGFSPRCGHTHQLSYSIKYYFELNIILLLQLSQLAP